MSLSLWSPQKRTRSGARRPAANSSRKRIVFRPRMEAVEQRCLLSAGALDTTFGNGGKVATSFLGPTNDFGLGGTVIQPDGKIVEAGYSLGVGNGGGGALVRYNADGTLDTSFGIGGKVVPDYTRFGGTIRGVALQSDGKIVIVGNTFFNQFNQGFEFTALRYNSDGSPDTTFGTGGMVVTSFGTGQDFAFAVALQGDGKIVVAGSNFELARYNSDGSLDTTFGSGGKVTSTFGGSANTLAIQSDGKIVAGGVAGAADFALARYNSNGTFDTSFGTGGEVTTAFGGIFQQINAVTVQSDGKIVAAGFAVLGATGIDFGLARYNSDGSLDATFGTGGLVSTDFGTLNDFGRAVTIQGDGKILVAGFDFGTGITGSDFLLARYNSDGSLDAGFGSGGKIFTDFGDTNDFATAVVIQSDGKIVAGGESVQPNTGYDFALARYNSDGSLDTTLGSGGKVTTNLGQAPTDAFGRGGVALQADGKLVVAGVEDRGFVAGGDEFAVARYNSDGSLDSNFGNSGEATTSFSGPALATSEVIQPDGKIVLAGTTLVSGRRTDFALVRYNPDGTLDTSFGSGGKVDTDFGPNNVEAQSVALQADGRIVVAGDAGFAAFALARYNPDGSLDSSFGTSGRVLTSGGGFAASLNSVAIQGDGKIVAAGYGAQQKNVGLEFALLRYNANGSLDSNFGKGGEVLTSFNGGGDQANAVAIQTDGRIVVAGFSSQGVTVGADFALARYNTDGSPDKSFGKNGQVLTNFGSIDNDAFSLALQGDGKIVAAGETFQQPTGFDFALARYNSDGSLDSNFGNSGLVITNFGGISQAIGVVIQADGNIVAAGTAFQTTDFDFALARYIGVAPTTPIDQIDAIIAGVQSLAATDVLTNGQGNSLQSKLQSAIEYLADGDTSKAVSELQAFVNEMDDYIAQGVLTSAEGQPLIDEADALITLFGKK